MILITVLINAFNVIRSNTHQLIEMLKNLDHVEKNSFSKKRDEFNNKLIRSEFNKEMAALFIFLNKNFLIVYIE